jgi:hypothetical protein
MTIFTAVAIVVITLALGMGIRPGSLAALDGSAAVRLLPKADALTPQSGRGGLGAHLRG